jgi:amino acid adenylation domain-containing protein
MRQVVDEVAAARGALPGLRRAFVGGDAVPPELLGAMRSVFPAAEVRVLYGPTEGTIICAAHLTTGGEAAGRHLLGRPLGNAPLYVLDGAGEPAPVGVPGELCIGGAATARGYLGRVELTADRFVPDPFSGEAGARTYRTGDRARWGADGTLEFLGRVDAQVKIRGFRIEPGEVEAQLAAHPTVRDAVVLVREDAPGDRRLVAYAVPSADPVGAAELREHLRARLPEHMVPSAIVVLEDLPLTRNGKVDRAALPAPETAGAGRERAAPRTPVEEVVAGIWAEVLGVEQVGAGDDFFELGGHSLLATQVVSRVREAFRIELPLRAVFEAPTVAGLALRVERLRSRAAPADEVPPLLPVPRDGSPLPLSFAQQRLWIIDRMEPGGSVYNMPLALRLRGPLDAGVLGRALGEVVRRHESLRTTFGDADGAPFQVVHPAGRPAAGTVDLARLPAAGREAEAGRLVRELARRPFDLAAGPLFRPALLRLAEAEHVLILAMHHVVSDAWSTGVMFRELSELYPAFLAGEASPLPELPVQYADFAAWQRAWLTGETLERELAWWRERLAGAPAALELPTDRPRPALPGPRAATSFRVLPRAAADAVRALARREGATTFMVLLAALDLLLARWSGEDDVVVGTPIANRNRRETEGLIGFFVNTLALRADVSGNPAFRGLLARVRESTLGAYQHQDVPFERLVESLGVERTTRHTPLFQVMFSLDDGVGAPRPFGGVAAEYLATGAPAAKFDLAVSAVAGEEGLAVRFGYREELWEASTIERVVEAYALLLEGAAADPSRAVLDLPLMADAERERMLREWSPGPAAPHPDLPLHGMFAAQAARTPDAVALTSGSETLTYAELDRRAEAIARLLRGVGVGRESRVGLCVERSPDAVAGILGILGAGAAYVPLDPAYPAERLAYMLEDSGATALLTQERLRGRLPAFGGRVVVLDEAPSPPGPLSPASGRRGEHDSAGGGDALSRSRTFALSHSPSADDLAYVIYTSGSTGTPKGVMVSHGAAAALVASAVETFGVGPGSSLVESASFSFDASVLETFLALASGATLHLADRDTLLSPEALGALLRERSVDVWVSTPALAGLAPRGDFPALRTVSTGGEACTAELVARWAPGRRMLNLYGPTETTVYATLHECGAGTGQAPPIGRPAAGARAYVLDAGGSPVPAGFPGELYLGGAGVARGYAGRPGLTAERFVPDPFGGAAGARMYRTGDRARWLGSGELEFLGRVDEQVKVRGFRIEPGEIEAVLLRHPSVRGAAAVVREDRPGDRRVVAYLEAEGGVPADELRDLARASLPEHMVPTAFVVLEALPLTPAGKLDRRALPAPEAVAADDAEPRTELERAVAAVWAGVLGVPRVGTAGSFFDLGGNSLLVVQLVARLEAALGRKVPVLDVFRYPSVAAMARHLSGGEAPETAPPADPDRPGKLAAGKGRLGQLRRRRDPVGE